MIAKDIKSNDTSKGSFKEGALHGHGSYEKVDRSYEGNFELGLEHGEGKIIFKNHDEFLSF